MNKDIRNFMSRARLAYQQGNAGQLANEIRAGAYDGLGELEKVARFWAMTIKG